MKFEVRNIENSLPRTFVESASAGSEYFLNDNVTFQLHRTLQCGASRSASMDLNTETTLAWSRWFEHREAAQGAAIGHYVFRDCVLLGTPGLILDVAKNVCWIGHQLGWRDAHLNFFVQQRGLGRILNNKYLEIDDASLRTAETISATTSAHLISSPGFSAYGHWLIDVIHRLDEACDASSLISQRVPIWGQSLMEGFGVNLRPQLLDSHGAVHCKELTVTSCIKSHGVLDSSTARRLWSRMRQLSVGELHRQPLNRSDKLYISRSKLRSSRKFVNSQAIENWFRLKGWSVVYPETLSIAEQMSVFSKARQIVGDDGSGLHNCVAGAPGVKVLCLNFDRTNLFHASLCAIADQQLAFLNSSKQVGNGGFYLPIPLLASAVTDFFEAH